jgi:hypothetical protein
VYVSTNFLIVLSYVFSTSGRNRHPSSSPLSRESECTHNISHASHNQHKYTGNPADLFEHLGNLSAQPSFRTFIDFLITKPTIKTMTSQNENDVPTHLNDLYHNSQSSNPRPYQQRNTVSPLCSMYKGGYTLQHDRQILTRRMHKLK